MLIPQSAETAAIKKPTFWEPTPEINNKQKPKLAINSGRCSILALPHHGAGPLSHVPNGGESLLFLVLDFALADDEIVNLHWMCW